jgi:hypothetical protein
MSTVEVENLVDFFVSAMAMGFAFFVPTLPTALLLEQVWRTN